MKRQYAALHAHPVVDICSGKLAKVGLCPYLVDGYEPERLESLLPIGWNASSLDLACAFAAALENFCARQVSLCLAVDLIQVSTPTFSRTLKTAIEQAHTNPNLLELALSEDSLTRASSAGSPALGKLQPLGVGLSLRGYGEGTTPLQLFQDFEFSSVSLAPRITEQLRHPLRSPHYSAAVVSCVLDLARMLDFEVIAVSIGAYEQAQCLRGLGCVLQHGSLYAPPVVFNYANIESALHTAWFEFF